MTYEETVTACRMQAAIMLIAYHRAVNTLLAELLDAVPQQYPYGQEATRAVRRFRARVQALALDWCGS
jgi:hypothetical protein